MKAGWDALAYHQSKIEQQGEQQDEDSLPYDTEAKVLVSPVRRSGRPPRGCQCNLRRKLEQEETLGAYFPEAQSNAEIMARLAAGAYDMLGYDCINPVFSVLAEAAALGREVTWGDKKNMPINRTSPWRETKDVKIPADFLEKPTTKAVLDAIRILRRKYGDHVAIQGKVMGPWTLAYQMHGAQDFLTETITAPSKVRSFLDRLQEITVLFGKAQIEAGADSLCLADHATGDLAVARCIPTFCFHTTGNSLCAWANRCCCTSAAIRWTGLTTSVTLDSTASILTRRWTPRQL